LLPLSKATGLLLPPVPFRRLEGTLDEERSNRARL